MASVTAGSLSTSSAVVIHEETFTAISKSLPSFIDPPTDTMSTEWSSAIRAPIHRPISGSRMSAEVNVTESKNSSSLPLSNVPYTRGPILYLDERTCKIWSSRGREMRHPEEEPYTRSRSVRADGTDGQDTKNTAFVRAPDTF